MSHPPGEPLGILRGAHAQRARHATPPLPPLQVAACFKHCAKQQLRGEQAFFSSPNTKSDLLFRDQGVLAGPLAGRQPAGVRGPRNSGSDGSPLCSALRPAPTWEPKSLPCPSQLGARLAACNQLLPCPRSQRRETWSGRALWFSP